MPTGTPNTFTAEQKKQITANYESGQTARSIAAKYNTSQQTILRRLRAWGVVIRTSGETRKKTFSPATRKMIIRRYRSGESLTKLCSDLPITRRTLSGRMAEWGVSLRSKSDAIRLGKGTNTLDNHRHAIVEAYENGYSCRQIAEQQGVSDHTIWDRLQEWDVETRATGGPRGPMSPGWNGGGAKEYRGLYWDEVQERIRNRDQRICRACRKTPAENGQELDVHHINGWYGDEWNDPRNVITLCKACHRSVETGNMPCPAPGPWRLLPPGDIQPNLPLEEVAG